MAYWGRDSPKDLSRASFILVGCRVARHTSLDESSDGYSGKKPKFQLRELEHQRPEQGTGGWKGVGGQGVSLRVPVPLPPIWSKILPRNRASSAQSFTKLCILIGLHLNTGLIIFRRLHSL